MKLNIALSANERYMPGATVAAAGVAVHARPETQLCFHLFTEEVKESSFTDFVVVLKRLHPGSEVIRHECDEAMLAGLPYWAGSRMAAVRCHYATLMPDVDWCLYLDCDILYLASVEEHFSYRDESVYACVVQEEHPGTRTKEREWILGACDVAVTDDKYFNSGVILFNFKKMRSDGIPTKLLKFFELHPDVPSPDQDALNAIFSNCVRMIPPKFDRLQIFLNDDKMYENPVIHYVMGNPWLPKYGCTANRRFRLWHCFADQYVYRKSGESYRRRFSKKMIVMKYICYYLLKCPFFGNAFAWCMGWVNLTTNWREWRSTQIA